MPKEQKTPEISLIGEPLITEKASLLSTAERSVYVFKIDPRANKVQVSTEIRKRHGVTPTRVNIINSPEKKIIMRGRVGTRGGYKKAIVYLKPGDKIDIA